MDSSQVISHVITAVLAVIAKDVVKWAWDLVKKTAATATTSAKAKAMFSKINLLILFDLLAIAAYVNLIVEKGWTDQPITGKSVLVIVVLVVLIASMIGILSGHLREAMNTRPPPP